MSARLAPLAFGLVLAATLSECAGSLVNPATPAPVTPSMAPVVEPTPAAPLPTPVPDPNPTPTPPPNAGDVVGDPNGPELSVEFPSPDVLDVTFEDADAKAWRVVVAGTGARAGDRLEVVVLTGDVGPAITVTEIQAGEVVQELDLGGFMDETAVSGGCHRTLNVCIDSSSFAFADDGTGRIRVRFEMPDPAAGQLLLSGGIAHWPGEPFVLGEWQDTQAFPWG